MEKEERREIEKIIISGDMPLFCDGYSSYENCLEKLIERTEKLGDRSDELENASKRLENLKKRLINLEVEFIKKTRVTLEKSKYSNIEVEYLNGEQVRRIKDNFTRNIESELDDGNIVISLDRNYIKSSDFKVENQDRLLFLDFTRFDDGEKPLKIVERPDFDDIELQYKNIAEKIAEIKRDKSDAKVIIADDVLFSGDTAKRVIDKMGESGVEINDTIFAIAVENAKGKELLGKSGVRVKSIKNYDTKNYENLIDEICSRDFIYGLPQSGRLTDVGDKRLLKPYFSPFGSADNASVPTDVELEFSKNCLEFSRDFWTEIDNYKGEKTTISNLPYSGKPFVPREYEDSSSIVEILDRAIADIDEKIETRERAK